VSIKQPIFSISAAMRNSVINNLNAPGLRTDVGGLWENFIVANGWNGTTAGGCFPTATSGAVTRSRRWTAWKS